MPGGGRAKHPSLYVPGTEPSQLFVARTNRAATSSQRADSLPMLNPHRFVFLSAPLLLSTGLSARRQNSASSTAAPAAPVHVQWVVVREQPMPHVLMLTGNLRGQ